VDAARGRPAHGGPPPSGAAPNAGTVSPIPRAAPCHLYVHVPFCRARCDYCDFFSTPVGEPAGQPGRALLDRYVDAVLAEWRLERDALGVRRLHTVFLGGGTPSLLGSRRLEHLLAVLDPLLTPGVEVTAETNPEDVTASYARWAAGRGLRVSLGVQSFVPGLRVALGRRAQAEPAAAFRRLRRAGCTNVGIDLIFGVPGQTESDLLTDLDAVASLRPDHVSWYELDVVEGTALASRPRAAAGRPECDERADMYRRVVRGLERLGYRWYEVSNFAAPGRRCRHNAAVWRGEDYLGLGPGAVSTQGDRRRRDAPDLEAYLAALAPEDGSGIPGRPSARPVGGEAVPAAGLPRGGRPPAAPPRETELLAPDERARERLYMAARTGAAAPLRDLQEALDSRAIGPLQQAGFVRVAGGTLRVTRKGRYVADQVCVRLFRDSCVQGTTATMREESPAIAPQETA
jgi:putative oxygen-independent coproporphyrinogen III oxidase